MQTDKGNQVMDIELKKYRLAVWLDDERPMPDSFDIHCKTATEAIELLKTGKVTRISLDHDLGDANAGTGYTVAKFIEEAVYHNQIPMPRCGVHTQNTVGRQNICLALQAATRFSMERNKQENGN